MMRGRSAQRGFVALAALFLLVVLGAMGAYMITFSNAQQINASKDVQGARAYWAARAGLEWTLASIAASPLACPASTPTSVDVGVTFNLAMTCSSQSYVESGATIVIYTVEATASLGTVGSLGYAERVVTATYEVSP